MKQRRSPIPQPKRPVATGSKQLGAAAKVNAVKLGAALAMHQQGRLDQAEVIYKEILQSQPQHFEALQLLATIATQRRNSAVAVQMFDQVLKLNPNHASSLYNRGNALRDLNRHEEAIDSYDRALKINPNYAEALYNRSNALRDLKRFEQARDSYDRTLKIKPDFAEALSNRGNVLRELRHHEAALDSYNRALKIKPDYVEALNGRGNALRDLKCYEQALESYDRVINIKPDLAEALSNRGHALLDLKRHEEALDSYDRSLKLNPDYEFLLGHRLNTKMKICDWSDVGNQLAQLLEKIEHGEKTSAPFPVLALSSSLALQKKAAEIWVQAKYPFNNALLEIPKRPKHDKIRIGYFSADFRNHPVSFLTAELFETHDRSKFELTAFAFGPDTTDDMRERLTAAFDHFINVQNQSDKDVAMLARSLEIDIAVDLGGFTTDSRTGIFALRAAPLQVSYLGYLGTMGAEYIDYLIADATILPETDQQYYVEKIVYLPSYQANDTKRRIADKVFTREELGLPQTGFVFCCFNNNYKIMPGTFDCWMRILKQVEGSALWLLADNAAAANNLRKEAASRNVDAERLIFAERMPPPEYLARYRIADLFLDTLPYNAGTTASDALWAGLPVLTCLGEAVAGRVAASLLKAIHLPELIASTPEAYEAVAIELASSPDRLAEIKRKLAENRLTTPLFDTRLFTNHIEAAYTKMYERYQADLAPEHIYVQD